MHMLSFQLHCISHFHGPENCNAVVGKCPAVLLECLFQSTWLNGRQLFLEVSHKFHNSPTAILKWKRLCKICLFLCSSHFCKVHESQKQTTSSLDWSGRELMHHLFVWAFFPSNGNRTSINSHVRHTGHPSHTSHCSHPNHPSHPSHPNHPSRPP